jgi:exodeoxyribonuclease VII small subunit
MSEPRPAGELDFETAMKELEEIVATLEAGKVDLNASISAYERGEALKARCEQLLRDAEARIERITLSRDGVATGVEPLDPA